jgi:hypothetical protein
LRERADFLERTVIAKRAPSIDMGSVGGELVEAMGGDDRAHQLRAGDRRDLVARLQVVRRRRPLPPIPGIGRLAVPAAEGKKLLESMLALGSLRSSISGRPL